MHKGRTTKEDIALSTILTPNRELDRREQNLKRWGLIEYRLSDPSLLWEEKINRNIYTLLQT